MAHVSGKSPTRKPGASSSPQRSAAPLWWAAGALALTVAVWGVMAGVGRPKAPRSTGTASVAPAEAPDPPPAAKGPTDEVTATAPPSGMSYDI